MSDICKFYKEEKEVSYDGGTTWIHTGEYRKGDLIEYESPDCGGTPQYRTISGETYCSGNTGCDKYVDVYSQVSYDSGETWSTISTTTTLVEEKSYDCGYREWTSSGTTYCDGSDLYRYINYEVSYDSGNTWIITATTSVLIESGSSLCSGYNAKYLTFIAQDNGTFTFSGNTGSSLSYSLDSGSTWSTPSSSFTTSTIQSGNKVLWKGTNSSNIGTFSSTGRFVAEGNSMSLIYGDDFSGQTSISTPSAFARMFEGCTGLTSAENMVLPARTLQMACYYGMFSGCTALTTAMEILPCTGTIRQSAYANMFEGCTSLTRAPELPGKLGSSSGNKNAYNRMFYGCSSLNYIKCLTTSVPEDDYGYPRCTASWVYGVAATGTFVKNASKTWPTGDKWTNSSIPDGWTVIDA